MLVMVFLPMTNENSLLDLHSGFLPPNKKLLSKKVL